MKTFWKLFSGTTGVILAIALCLLATCAVCVLATAVVPIAFPITPTP